MSCQSLENLLGAIDQAIAEFDPRNHRYLNSLRKDAERYRAASRSMRSEINKVIRKRYQS